MSKALSFCFAVSSLFAISPPYFSQNRQFVAENLNALSAQGLLTAGLSSIYANLNALSNAPLNSALDELHPAPYSSFVEIQASNGGQLLDLFHRDPSVKCCPDKDWRPWLVLTGNWLREGSVVQQIGFTARTQGFAAGIDKKLGEDWSFGAGAAWDHTDLQLHANRGSGQTNRYLGAFYTDYEIDCFYPGFSFYGGLDTNDLTRRILFSSTNLTARGDFHALDLAGQFAAAYLFKYSTFLLSPYGNVDYLYLDADHFTETGADGANLAVNDHPSGTIRSSAGIFWEMLDANLAETICIQPSLAMAWSMVCPVGRPFYTASFSDEPISFHSKGWNQTWQLLTLDFRLGVSIY